MAQRRLIQAIYDQQALLKAEQTTTAPSSETLSDVCEVQVRSTQFRNAVVRNNGKKVSVAPIYCFINCCINFVTH